jgi:single-stranded-DNA-specific exonuclease
LNAVNDERKGTVASMVKEMKRLVGERVHTVKRNVLVIGNPKWRPSLVGPAAHSLSEEHSCPVFVWGRDGNEKLKGSCRSDGSVSLLELMEASAPGTFIEFGGHKLSGGFTVALDRVHTLEEELSKAFEKISKKEMVNAGIGFVDATLSLEELTWDLYDSVSRLAPFGMANPKPLFLFERVVVREVKKFGKQGNHVELKLERSDRILVSAIKFFADRDLSVESLLSRRGTEISLVAHVEKMIPTWNKWMKPELRLRIVDIL